MFEGAGNTEAVIVPAIFSISPGVFNGYLAEDVVILGFENNHFDQPVVLGKLYLGSEQENQPTGRGTVTCDTLRVTQNLELPISTSFVQDLPDTAQLLKVTGCNNISDMLTLLQQQSTTIARLEAIIGEELRTVQALQEAVSALQTAGSKEET